MAACGVAAAAVDSCGVAVDYSGFVLEPGAEIPHLALDDNVTPQYFYDEFVAKRKPCVLRGKLPDARFEKWELQYLRERSGEKKVEVEVSVLFGSLHIYEFAFCQGKRLCCVAEM